MPVPRNISLGHCTVAVLALACSEASKDQPGGSGGSTGISSGSSTVGGSSRSLVDASGGSNTTRFASTSGGRSVRSTEPRSGADSTSRAASGGRTLERNTAVGGAQSTELNTASGGRRNSGLTVTGASSGTKLAATGGTKPDSTAASGGMTSSTAGTSNTPIIGAQTIAVSGRQLLLNGKPFRIRGVCWNPVPKGENHPEGIDYPGLAPKDVPLMKAANINAVRTYEPLTNVSVLDQLADAGLYVLNSVYPYGGAPASDVTARVNAVKNHPAMLIWVIGNEWNYNGLYVDMAAADAQARLNEVARLIRAADPNHPIATVYGELPPKAVVDAMPDIDLWGVNVYSGITFGDRFANWAATSSKPMFLAEYGADAFNANTGSYDPQNQAAATEALTLEIADNCSDTHSTGVALGGTLFEWADEWWKASGGSLDVHDNGGVAPGGGPYPDSTFNEEWWGIVDIDRNPRLAYDALKSVYGMQ